MHPTVDEQLAGIARLLDVVASESELSDASAEAMANARRLLTQVGRSWAELLPFYVGDSAALACLLTRAGRPAEQVDVGMDVRAAAARNAELRRELSGVVAGLDDTSHSAPLRAEILDYLSARVAADPS
jgi:hypothetical protein